MTPWRKNETVTTTTTKKIVVFGSLENDNGSFGGEIFENFAGKNPYVIF